MSTSTGAWWVHIAGQLQDPTGAVEIDGLIACYRLAPTFDSCADPASGVAGEFATSSSIWQVKVTLDLSSGCTVTLPARQESPFPNVAISS